MQSTEAQLADAVAELEDMKSKFKQISTRNALLEKVANIHDQPAAFVTTNGASQQWQVVALPPKCMQRMNAVSDELPIIDTQANRTLSLQMFLSDCRI